MSKLRAAILLGFVLALIFPYPVLAATSGDVVITATPYLGPPTNFTLTHLGGLVVEATWMKNPAADNTMVRISGEDYPSNIADGTLLYMGAGESAQFNVFDLDTTTIYASAWSELGGGYSGAYATAKIGGVAVFLLALAIIPLGLTIGMFHTKNMTLGFPCVIFWAILGAYAYGQSAGPWSDWWYYMFFGSAFGMTTFSAMSMFALRHKDLKEPDADQVTYIDEVGKGKADINLDQERVKPQSRLVRGIRERALQRRAKGIRA
jgi:hypothetical protein